LTLSNSALKARRLGILGGSFDPPHLGHRHAAESARRAFALEHVVFVPAARPPHKPERVLAEAGERLAMLELLLADEPAASIWDVELARAGPSYTVATLRELRALVDPATRLFLVLGEDNLPGFPGWKDVEEVVALAQPVVVHRRGAPPPALDGLSPFARGRLELGILHGAALDVSSTELRARLGRGEAAPELLPPALREFIRAHGLYRESGGTGARP